MAKINFDINRADDPLYYRSLCKDTIDGLLRYKIKTEKEIDLIVSDAITNYEADDNILLHFDSLDDWEDIFTPVDIVELLKSARAFVRDKDENPVVWVNPAAKNEWRHFRKRIMQDKGRRKITSIQAKINGYSHLVAKAEKSEKRK